MSAALARSASLRGNRRFAAYWSAQTVSQLGDRVSELALPLIAVSVLHATPTEVGLLVAAVWLPYLVSLFVGSWVEHRQHKRRILVWADLARVAVLGTVPVAAVAGTLTLDQLYAVAILLGLGEVYFNTAVPNVFVALVDRESYIAASSAVSASRSGSFIAGPALGGWLVQLLGGAFTLLVDALSFCCSALLLGRIPLREPKPAATPGNVTGRAWDGLRFVVRHKYLRVMLGCSTTINFFSFVAAALLVLFARRTLGLSAGLIGLAFAVGAGGSLFGAVAAPRVGRWWGTGRVGLVGAIIFSVAMAVPVLAGGSTAARAAILAAAEFASGFGVMFYDVSFNAVKTAVTPDEMRSRVSGAYSTINYGVRPIGSVVGGVLGATIGIRPTFLLAAAGAALSVLWLLGSPLLHLRAMADLDDIDPHTGLPRAPIASTQNTVATSAQPSQSTR
jgi:MFS family permease